MALLSLHEQTAFGGIYSQLREITLLERDEQKAWAEVRQLESLSDVDPQTRVSVRSALVQAKLLNWNIRVDLEQPIARAKKIGYRLRLETSGRFAIHRFALEHAAR